MKATDARKFLDEALDEECQRTKILEMQRATEEFPYL